MSLVTRCPVCATAFRVQRDQLAARGGRVRCGKCGTVFDGVGGLVEDGGERLALEPSPQLGLFDPGRRAAHAAAHGGQATSEPSFLAEPAPRTRATLLWALLALVAALALLSQVAYRYRTEMAVLLPRTKPVLQSACRILRCEVTLPRRPELMSIDASDLQSDPKRENLIVLNAVIRNRAPFAQEYPALELSLTDEADRPVLRRVLEPADYLDRARAAQLPEGIAAGSDANLRVYLDPGRARATGYRLYLFYPQ